MGRKTSKLPDKDEEELVDEGKGFVPVPSDLWSEDSSFYGDDETKAHLEAEVASFNPRELWDVQSWNFQCLIAQQEAPIYPGATRGVKRKREKDSTDEELVEEKKLKTEARKSSISDASTLTASPSASPAKEEPFNPYEGTETAYQLSETLDDFFKRLRPSTTTTESGPWIWIANPYARRRQTYDDIGGFKQEGFRLLEAYTDRKQEIEDKNPGKAPGIITRKLKPHRDHLESEIARIARARQVTCGKWMLFPMPEDVNSIWRVVAKATLEGKLGCAAKVATDNGDTSRRERLVCVYTDDFSDKADIERVLLEMKNLDLPVSGKDGRGIYYKCDAYTYLDIVSGNEYKLRASMYSSNDFLGETTKGRRKS